MDKKKENVPSKLTKVAQGQRRVPPPILGDLDILPRSLISHALSFLSLSQLLLEMAPTSKSLNVRRADLFAANLPRNNLVIEAVRLGDRHRWQVVLDEGRGWTSGLQLRRFATVPFFLNNCRLIDMSELSTYSFHSQDARLSYLLRFLAQCFKTLTAFISSHEFPPTNAFQSADDAKLPARGNVDNRDFLSKALATEWGHRTLFQALAQCTEMRYFVVYDPTILGTYESPHDFAPVLNQWPHLRELQVHLKDRQEWSMAATLDQLVDSAKTLQQLETVVLRQNHIDGFRVDDDAEEKKRHSADVAALDHFLTAFADQLRTFVLEISDVNQGEEFIRHLADGRLHKLRHFGFIGASIAYGTVVYGMPTQQLLVRMLTNNPELETLALNLYINHDQQREIINAIPKLARLRRLIGFPERFLYGDLEWMLEYHARFPSSGGERSPVQFYPATCFPVWQTWTTMPVELLPRSPYPWAGMVEALHDWKPETHLPILDLNAKDGDSFHPNLASYPRPEEQRAKDIRKQQLLRMLPWQQKTPFAVWSAFHQSTNKDDIFADSDRWIERLRRSGTVDYKFWELLRTCYKGFEAPVAVCDGGRPEWKLSLFESNLLAGDAKEGGFVAKQAIKRGTLLAIEHGHASMHPQRLAAMLLLSPAVSSSPASALPREEEEEVWCPFITQWSLQDWNRAMQLAQFKLKTDLRTQVDMGGYRGVLDVLNGTVFGCFPLCGSRLGIGRPYDGFDAAPTFASSASSMEDDDVDRKSKKQEKSSSKRAADNDSNIEWGFLANEHGTAVTLFLVALSNISKGDRLYRSPQPTLEAEDMVRCQNQVQQQQQHQQMQTLPVDQPRPM